MSVAELLPTLQSLSAKDKREVFEFLRRELREEPPLPLEHGATYAVWSPYDAYEAAEVLKELLATGRPENE